MTLKKENTKSGTLSFVSGCKVVAWQVNLPSVTIARPAVGPLHTCKHCSRQHSDRAPILRRPNLDAYVMSLFLTFSLAVIGYSRFSERSVTDAQLTMVWVRCFRPAKSQRPVQLTWSEAHAQMCVNVCVCLIWRLRKMDDFYGFLSVSRATQR